MVDAIRLRDDRTFHEEPASFAGLVFWISPTRLPSALKHGEDLPGKLLALFLTVSVRDSKTRFPATLTSDTDIAPPDLFSRGSTQPNNG